MATAAPATPMCSTRMQNKSSTIFKSAAITKKITGVLESPMERIMAEVRLYRIVTGMPAKIITI